LIGYTSRVLIIDYSIICMFSCDVGFIGTM
jgi:hypothetical protein